MDKAHKAYEEFFDLAKGRTEVFRMLSVIHLKEPSEEFVSTVTSDAFLSAFQAGKNDFEGFRILKDFAVKSRDIDNLQRVLKLEYTNLFIAPGGQYVPPYESVYACKGGLVWGESTRDVVKTLKEVGIEMSKEYTELPDHIGLELELMHFLCDREANAWKSGDKTGAFKYLEIQKEFLDSHLNFEAFYEKVIENAEHGFYKGIAMLTREYIKLERSQIDGIIDEANRA